VAATGEYTAFHGGTVADGQAAIVTAINRVNGIYENDLSVRMVLVGNNSSLVYTNGATDPYTNGNGGAMLGENQSNVDLVIGNANYDIGHVFSTGGGGVAGLGVVGITGLKARGVTGQAAPIGDPFYVDYVAHEMGHQFGGSHTFNGDSGNCAGGNRSGAHAYEPGSGTTIQAYAGICGNDNLQLNSDPFFHSESIEQIRDTITSGPGNTAATITNTGNAIPTVNAGANFVIPAGTPFELTAIGNDADGGDVLTYSWEQRDLGPQQDVNAGDNGSSPLFRAWTPTEDDSRVFPRMTDLLNNTTVIGETLPTTNRTMNFRAVVRDNSALDGGGVNTDDMTVQVIAGAAFQVTSQNVATTWTGGTIQTISWNVAGTNTGAVNTPNVDILFAADGINYDTVLATAVPNDGSQTIVAPGIATTTGRFKVRGSGNIFFDINNVDIEVLPGGPGVSIAQSGGTTSISEAGLTDSYELALNTTPAGPVEITVSADAQSRVSLDGTTFSSSVIVLLSNTSPSAVFVEAIDDTVDEGTHTSTISHQITSTGDSVDYPLSLSIPDVVATVADNDAMFSDILVGVNFAPSGDASPTNWSSINASPSTVSLTDLINENGDATPFDLTVEENDDGGWSTFDAAINPSTIPVHTNNLSNLAGQIFSGSDSFTVTWSDLDVGKSYNVFVFGIEGFFPSISQQVSIMGQGSPLVFNQNFNQNVLAINDQLGSSSDNLLDYGITVLPNSSGQIVIDIDPLAGGNDVVLGGLALVENSQLEVENVKVGGSGNYTNAWATSYNNLVDPTAASGFQGYSIPDGSAGGQDDVLPWVNIDTIYVTFSEDVDLSTLVASNFSIVDVDGSNGTPSVIGTPEWDSNSKTAKLTLNGNLGTDRYELQISDDVTSVSGSRLNGEYINDSDSLPSGDGFTGGDFNFSFNVLHGDFDHSANPDTAIVLLSDLSLVSGNFATSTTISTMFVDGNADGIILLEDLSIVSGNFTSTLPSGSLGRSTGGLGNGGGNDGAQGRSGGKGLTGDMFAPGVLTGNSVGNKNDSSGRDGGNGRFGKNASPNGQQSQTTKDDRRTPVARPQRTFDFNRAANVSVVRDVNEAAQVREMAFSTRATIDKISIDQIDELFDF